MRASVALAIVTSLVGVHARALADSTLDACNAAAVEGQKLDRAGKPLEARARFAACARAECRDDIRADCNHWLAAAERRLGAIVVDARDDRGRPVADAVVSIDGQPLAPEASAGARPVPLDPGTHEVTFERKSGAKIARTVVLREGQRADVAVMFATTSEAVESPSAPEKKRTFSTPVWVVGGVAVLGFATFGTAATLGYGDWSASRCGESCAHADATRVGTKLLVADIGLGVGVAAALVAAGLYLAQP